MKSLYNRTQRTARIPLLILGMLCIQMNIHGAQAESKATAELIDAILDQKYDDAVSALQAGANPNGRSFKHNVLVLATRHTSDENMVKLLLDCKADPNIHEGIKEASPLMEAANTTPSIFKLLLYHKASVKYKTHPPSNHNVLYRVLSPYLCHFSDQDRLSCLVLVMEKTELDDSDVEFTYNRIEEAEKDQNWMQEDIIKARKIINTARLEDYKRKRTKVITALETTLPLFTPLRKIVADYGTTYYCMDTRPLTITMGS